MGMFTPDLFECRTRETAPRRSPVVLERLRLPQVMPDARLLGGMLARLSSSACPEKRTGPLQHVVGARYFEGQASRSGEQHRLCRVLDAAVTVLAAKTAREQVASFTVSELLTVMNPSSRNGRAAELPHQVELDLQDAMKSGLVEEHLALGGLLPAGAGVTGRAWTLKARALASIFFDLQTTLTHADQQGVSLRNLRESTELVHAYMAGVLAQLNERELGERIGSIARRRALFAQPSGEAPAQVNGAHGSAYFMALHEQSLRADSAEYLAAAELEKRGMLVNIEREFRPRMSSLCAVLGDLCGQERAG